MAFLKKLNKLVKKNNSLLCVGLDSNVDKLPSKFKKEKYPQFAFNKYIIDQTYDLVCAYKPNSAFYEARGVEGIKELKMTCDYTRSNFPEIPIILDAKRADIGNTNNGYVKFVFEYLCVDAVTIHPYLGREAVQPFLDRKDKGVIVLCRTSNPGAGEFQDIKPSRLNLKGGLKGLTLSEYIAHQATYEWNKNENCMLVVGATYPDELSSIRKIAGDMTILVPGIGAQGGDVEKTIRAGLNSQNAGMIINSSRGIIFSKDPRTEAQSLRDQINKYR